MWNQGIRHDLAHLYFQIESSDIKQGPRRVAIQITRWRAATNVKQCQSTEVTGQCWIGHGCVEWVQL